MIASIYLKTSNKILAFRRANDREWNDPHGGVFTSEEQDRMTWFAEGTLTCCQLPGGMCVAVAVRFEDIS